jgi:hypothetical protein
VSFVDPFILIRVFCPKGTHAITPTRFVARPASALCAAMADPLEGTKWKIKVEPDDASRGPGIKAFDDTLTLKGGKLESKFLKDKGFEPADYDGDTRGMSTASFTATLKSEKEGSAKWTGAVTGPAIKGELVWTKKDGSEVRYNYSGEKQ